MTRALFIEHKGASPEVSLRELPIDELPEGDLDVEVLWSGINYKDALAITGRSPIVRAPFPFVPGIDLAGRVVESRSDRFREGDVVVQTGWGLGETRWGGYSQRARLRSEHVIALPDGLAPDLAMLAGTAGFTAMLAVMALESYGMADGPILVTGASGGVGGWATVFLSRLGHAVTVSTGSTDTEYLNSLGAVDIIPREALSGGASRSLDSARWGGAIDSVGGKTLEALLSQVGTRGAVAACGLAGGTDIHTSVFPFILRGVGLLGIDSNTCPQPLREMAWGRIADMMENNLLALMGQVIDLADVPAWAGKLLDGQVRGRAVVRCSP